MDTIHAIRPDGRVLQGTDALRALFGEVGLGWVVTLMESPLLAKIVDLIYEFLSKNRIKISGTFDALVAAKRISMSKAGVEVCGGARGMGRWGVWGVEGGPGAALQGMGGRVGGWLSFAGSGMRRMPACTLQWPLMRPLAPCTPAAPCHRRAATWTGAARWSGAS